MSQQHPTYPTLATESDTTITRTCPPVPTPCGWPGSQNVDALYHVRDACYAQATADDPQKDVWSTDAQMCRQRVAAERFRLGKSVCQRRNFKSTPVLWFYPS